MKYVVLVAVIVAILWLLRHARTRREADDGRPAKGPPAPPAVQQDMVECPVCRVHLPRTDALPGPGGRLYCCAEHRQRAGS